MLDFYRTRVYRRKNCQKKTDSPALFISSPFWFKRTLFGSLGPFWDLFGVCWNVDIVAVAVGSQTVWLHSTKNLLCKELYFDCWSILFCVLELISLPVVMSTTTSPLSSPANHIRSLDLKPKVSFPVVCTRPLFSSEFACFAHYDQVCQLAKLPPEMIALISR